MLPGLLALFSLAVVFEPADAAPPNVVLVMTDDQGYGDLSCHGNPVLKTPNIDKLYAESIRLADYHVAPTCSPTRCALLTGHWTNRTGVWHTIMGRSMLRENEVTLGQIFNDAGYATGMFGKWHLGDNYPYRPEDRGFTEVMRHGGGGVGQTPDYWDNAYFDGSYFHNGKVEAVQGFCTDVWFDYAKRFIAAQNKAGKPFLAYIAPNAPHGPMHSPELSSAPYRDQNVHVANFFGMIANIDDNVGKLRNFLEKQGLTENTIFIFTTDNGTSSGAGVYNADMRGAKGSEYDGGHRVPFFIHWPAKGWTEARDVTPITAHVDIVPTLIDLCGVPAPEGVKFDGHSIRPLLENKASIDDGTWPDRMLITDSQRVKDPIKWRKSAVMTSQWRLNNGVELYDIKADPGQKQNVAGQNPEVVARLREFYEDWWAELEPTFSQATPIHLGHERGNPATLTCHDWITTQMTPWNQSQIRNAMTGEENTGFWNVKVVEDGLYSIAVRRWPKETDLAIDAELAPGAPVPGDKAFRSTPGKAFPAVKAKIRIADQQAEANIAPGDKEAVFNLRLSAGTTTLSGRFFDTDGNGIGTYYAYVKKL
jgi:arylsulfatase B